MGSVDQASGAYSLVSEPSGILVDESHVLSPQKNESDAASMRFRRARAEWP
jgi:hypothetical protein